MAFLEAHEDPSDLEIVEAPVDRLGPAHLAFFEREGYLAIDRITSEADVALIRSELQRLFETKAGFDEGALFDFAGADNDDESANFDPKAPQMLGPERFAPKLRQSLFYKNARAIARQILGPEVSLKQSHSIMKPARSGAATPWHQDEAFGDPALDYHEISFWLALQPTDRRNSCMRFIPGSHKWPIVPHISPNGDTRVHALDCSASVNEDDAVDGVLPAGGCTLHTTKTVHGAGPNPSDEARWAYILVFGTDPTPHQGQRAYPWRAEKDTGRLKRRKAWLSRGGLFVVLWRRIKQKLFA